MKTTALLLALLFLLPAAAMATAASADGPVFPPPEEPNICLPLINQAGPMFEEAPTLPAGILPSTADEASACTVRLQDGSVWILPNCNLR